jgi:hypothetical protein
MRKFVSGVSTYLVEFPQQRHLVAEPVIEPVAELVGEKEHHGDDRSRDVAGKVDGDTGPKSATSPEMMPFEMNW